MVDDVDDFDAWYAGSRPPMAAALAVWCGDAALASDALDEAFVRAIERWERVRHLASPGGWVWRTATNVVRRRARRIALEERLLRRHAAGERDVVAGPTGHDVDLREALLELSERQRTAVVLHYIADLPVREVAAAMEIAEGTVHATLHRARQRLSERLGESSEPAGDIGSAESVEPAEPSSTSVDRSDGAVR